MKIGILGGTFDPIHLGHLHIARAAYTEYELSEVWFMPAGDPYFKEDSDVTDPGTRFEMTAYTLKGMSEPFIASDFEIRKYGRTYTAETLSELCSLYPEARFFFIMGLDSLRALKTWYMPDEIMRDAVVLCAGRESEEDIDTLVAGITANLSSIYPLVTPDIRAIHTYELPISSTLVRERAKVGEEFRSLLHERTYRFITDRGLYR